MEGEGSVMQDGQPRCAVCCAAAAAARSGRLLLFAATRVGRSREEGIMGDGVRWREVAAGESRVCVTVEEGRSRLRTSGSACVN